MTVTKKYFFHKNLSSVGPLCTGWPNKNRTFLRYHIFAATTDIIMQFLLKYSEITAENNKRQFFKQVLNILRKVTGNVSDVRGTAHRMWSTAASQPISATSLVNHTISSTVLQETHASCNQHSNIFKLVKP